MVPSGSISHFCAFVPLQEEICTLVPLAATPPSTSRQSCEFKALRRPRVAGSRRPGRQVSCHGQPSKDDRLI